jgi:hypothetical protein
MKHYLLSLSAAALLAACGGGGGGSEPLVDANAAANTASSAFIASLLGIISGTSETAEPVSADSVTLGASETQQTSPL